MSAVQVCVRSCVNNERKMNIGYLRGHSFAVSLETMLFTPNKEVKSEQNTTERKFLMWHKSQLDTNTDICRL